METKIKTLIIDDESGARALLQSMLNDHCPEVEVVADADSMATGLKAIATYKPQLVFLDIKMPHGTGFDLLEQVPNKDFEVIFTTAHDEYGIKAIKFAALDYLLKPIDIDELQDAIVKARRKIQDRTRHLDEQLKVLFANFQNESRKLKQVALPTQDGILFLPVREILRCEADGSYTRIHRINGDQVLISKNLKEIEGLLEGLHFCRVHKSHLIGLDHVVRYIKGKGGEVEMKDGTTVEVSVRRREAFLKMLMDN